VEGDVALRDDGLEAMVLELVLTEGAAEEAAIVLALLDVDHERALELGLGEDHGNGTSRGLVNSVQITHLVAWNASAKPSGALHWMPRSRSTASNVSARNQLRPACEGKERSTTSIFRRAVAAESGT